MRQSDLGAVQASHTTDVLRLGGFAILVSFLGAVLATGPSGQEFVLIWSGLIIFLVGAWEDLSGNVSARRRVVASMIAAAAALVLSETAITRLDIEALDLIFGALPPVAMLLTVLLSAAYTHAFNLIDGMNGLSSTVDISMAIALASAANVHGQAAIGTTSLVLAAAIFGFPVMNWPKGKIFLGWRSLFDRSHSYVDRGHVVRGCAVLKCRSNNPDNILTHCRTDRHDCQAHDSSGALGQARQAAHSSDRPPGDRDSHRWPQGTAAGERADDALHSTGRHRAAAAWRQIDGQQERGAGRPCSLLRSLRGILCPSAKVPFAIRGATSRKQPHIVAVPPGTQAAEDRTAMKAPDPVDPEKSGRTKCRSS